MPKPVAGLHHVTAICSDPQANLDFYASMLGQRLVKKTVNFDEPGTYHLYYGDETGAPGSILTFFPFVDAGPGRAGPGMASAVAYGVSPSNFDALMMQLAEDVVDFSGPQWRFGQRVISLLDPDGMTVEFVEIEGATPNSIHSITLWLSDPNPTMKLLNDILGYEEVARITADGVERIRLQVPGGAQARTIDVITDDRATIARQGAGTIHHIAFRAAGNADQLEFRQRLQAAGFDVTPVIDRQYFNAIYFREPGGALFEIATDPPGFSVDEPVDQLGQNLKLPPKFEGARERIERRLPEISVPSWSGK